jgi:hypothetical protein
MDRLRPSSEAMRHLRTAKILSHERNIQRYCRLLATELTELERRYLHKRIAEERAELERWSRQDQSADDTSSVIAAPGFIEQTGW